MPDTPPDRLTIEEAAEALGVTPGAIRGWAAAGKCGWEGTSVLADNTISVAALNVLMGKLTAADLASGAGGAHDRRREHR